MEYILGKIRGTSSSFNASGENKDKVLSNNSSFEDLSDFVKISGITEEYIEESDNDVENYSIEGYEVEYITNTVKRMKICKENSDYTFTENGENAFSSTGEMCLDFFGNTNRDAGVDIIIANFINAWNENPEVALKILYNMRDIREGKGEKFISRIILFYLKIHHEDLYNVILYDIIYLGCWKDILFVCELGYRYNKISMDKEVEAFVNQLSEDEKNYNSGLSISLCGKWAPGENTHYNKKGLKIANKITESLGITPRQYRHLLSKLRGRINVTEKNMSTHNFENIIFKQVPSKCHMNNRKAFSRVTNTKGFENTNRRENLVYRYEKYLYDLKNNKTTANFKGIQPHEIVSKILSGGECDEILESQWNSIVSDVKNTGVFENAIAISDVSGSMSGTPMNVSIAMGILVSECCQGAYNNKLITFDENPVVHLLPHHIYQKINYISRMPWGMNTDIEKVFDLVLDMALKRELDENEMVKTVFIFTDMQFDECSGNKNLKTFEKFREKFSEKGYKLPNIVCWNLRTVNSVPFKHDDKGVSMISGFSSELLKSFVGGGDMTPIGIMNNVISKYTISKEYIDIVKNTKMKRNSFDMDKLKRVLHKIKNP